MAGGHVCMRAALLSFVWKKQLKAINKFLVFAAAEPSQSYQKLAAQHHAMRCAFLAELRAKRDHKFLQQSFLAVAASVDVANVVEKSCG